MAGLRLVLVATLVITGCEGPRVTTAPQEPPRHVLLRRQVGAPARLSWRPPPQHAWRWGPDHRRIVAWRERELHIVDLASPNVVTTVRGWTAPLEGAHLARDADLVAGELVGGGVEVRDVKSAVLHAHIDTDFTPTVVTLSNSGDYIALSRGGVTSDIQRTEVWHIDGGRRMSRWDEGYLQLQFLPGGDYNLAGAFDYPEAVSVRNIGDGRELWRHTVGTVDCALETQIVFNPSGTYFAYVPCGHALYVQRLGGHPGAALARSGGCGPKHIAVTHFDGDEVVAYNADWYAAFSMRSGRQLRRTDDTPVWKVIDRGGYRFEVLEGGGMFVHPIEDAGAWRRLDDVGAPSRDGRYVVSSTRVTTVANGEATELPFELAFGTWSPLWAGTGQD